MKAVVPTEASEPHAEPSMMVDPSLSSSHDRDVEFHKQSPESEQSETQYWIVEGASRRGRVIYTAIFNL